MVLEANAKINIGLLVGKKRDDGFHDIETIMARISLKDRIELEIKPSPSLVVSIKGNEGYIGTGMDLMEKAAIVFSNLTGFSFSLDISIDKKIPSEAGLGGGSSDAAAVFSFLNEYFGEPLEKEELIASSFAIGSDVPFFVSGYSGAFVSGKGDAVEEAYVPHGKKLLLLVPNEKTKTGEAYSKLDAIERKKRRLPSLLDSFPSRSTHPNDFELVSHNFYSSLFPPEILSSGAYISMTGSGSAWYALFSEDTLPKFDNPEKYGIVSAYII